MRYIGETTEGVYVEDPMEAIHPDIINRYYGVEGAEVERDAWQTGAGHTSEDDQSDDESSPADEYELESDDARTNLENRVAGDLEHNIRHEPIQVAKHQNLFRSDGQEAEFFTILEMVVADGLIPEDHGVQPSEWDDGVYPELEVIKPGTRGKAIDVVLTRDIWLPRAIQWTQALDLMSRLLIDGEQDIDSSDG